MPISPSSANRVKRFIDQFIRSRYVESWSSEKDSDFFNEPERAGRVADAAVDGAYGATHAEIIEDWRESFETWIKYDRRSVTLEYKHHEYHCHEYPARFAAAVQAHFDAVELWHERNGSLHQEIG